MFSLVKSASPFNQTSASVAISNQSKVRLITDPARGAHNSFLKRAGELLPWVHGAPW
jgi:hypothetical protein